jgi:hypothetical protein
MGQISPPVSLGCGEISKYTTSLESYKEIEPYAAAYTKAGKAQEGAMLRFSELKAGMSSYKDAHISLGNVGSAVGGAMGLFYKTPTGDWTFFIGTQAAIPCADFDTKDLQYSFAYETCYDSTKTGGAADSLVGNYYHLEYF